MVKDYGMCSCGGRIHPQWFFGKKYLECAKCGNPDKNAEQEDGELLLVEQTLSMFGLTVAEVVEQNITYKSEKPYGTAQVVIDKYTRELYQNPDRPSKNRHFHNSFGAYASQLKNFNKWVGLIKSHSKGGSSGPDGRCVFIVSLLINRETGEVLRSYQGVESKNAESKKEPYPNFPLSDKDVLYYKDFIRKNSGRYPSMVKFFENAFERPIETPVKMWNNKKHPFYPVYALHDRRLPEHKICKACGKKGHSANSKKCPLFKSKPRPTPVDEYGRPKPKPKRETAAYLQWTKEEKLRRGMIKRLEHLMMMLNDLSIEFEEYYTDKFRISWTPDGRIQQSWTTKGPYDGSWRNEDETKAEIQRILNKFPNSVAYWGIKATGDGISVAHLDKAKRSRPPQQYEAESKKLPPVEKAEISGIASGATMEGLEMLAAEEPPEKDDPLESWMEDYDAEDPSVYWWVKGALMENTKDRDMTEDDLVYIIQMVAANAPMDSITKGMREAEQFGDKGVWEILKLAAMGRAEILTDKQIHSEKLRDYRSEGFICEMSDCYSRDMCEQCLDEGDFYCWECCARDSQVHWDSEEVITTDEGWIAIVEDSESGEWYCWECGVEYGKGMKGKLLAEKCFKTDCASDGTLTPQDKRYLQLHDLRKEFLREFPKDGGYQGEVKRMKYGNPIHSNTLEPRFHISTGGHRGLVSEEHGNSYDGFHYELNKESLNRLNQFVDEYNTFHPSSRIVMGMSYSEKGHRSGVDLYFTIDPQSFEAEMVEMVECPYCSEFGDGEIPADIQYDPGDRWEPPSLDVNSWETCEWCNGKGEVTEEEAEGIPTWDWDILEPDEPDYDRYDAECVICKDEIGEVVCTNCVLGKSAEETNGDKQLELALKRTQMSALRTGLSVLTFGIVILSTFTGWNFWTNKKQEQQISDIMGLV